MIWKLPPPRSIWRLPPKSKVLNRFVPDRAKPAIPAVADGFVVSFNGLPNARAHSTFPSGSNLAM